MVGPEPGRGSALGVEGHAVGQMVAHEQQRAVLSVQVLLLGDRRAELHVAGRVLKELAGDLLDAGEPGEALVLGINLKGRILRVGIGRGDAVPRDGHGHVAHVVHIGSDDRQRLGAVLAQIHRHHMVPFLRQRRIGIPQGNADHARGVVAVPDGLGNHNLLLFQALEESLQVALEAAQIRIIDHIAAVIPPAAVVRIVEQAADVAVLGPVQITLLGQIDIVFHAAVLVFLGQVNIFDRPVPVVLDGFPGVVGPGASGLRVLEAASGIGHGLPGFRAVVVLVRAVAGAVSRLVISLPVALRRSVLLLLGQLSVFVVPICRHDAGFLVRFTFVITEQVALIIITRHRILRHVRQRGPRSQNQYHCKQQRKQLLHHRVPLLIMRKRNLPFSSGFFILYQSAHHGKLSNIKIRFLFSFLSLSRGCFPPSEKACLCPALLL